MAANETAAFHVQQAALHPVAQGIGPVQHHQPLARGGAVGDAVPEGGDEGIVAAAYVGNVVDQSIEPVQIGLGKPLGFLGIEAADGETAFGVDLVFKKSAGGFVAPDTMLRRQQKLQIAAFLQNRNGGAVVPGTAGGTGEQGHTAGEQMGKFPYTICAKQNHWDYLLDKNGNNR